MVVALSVEWSLPTPECSGSQNDKKLYLTFIFCQVSTLLKRGRDWPFKFFFIVINRFLGDEDKRFAIQAKLLVTA